MSERAKGGYVRPPTYEIREGMFRADPETVARVKAMIEAQLAAIDKGMTVTVHTAAPRMAHVRCALRFVWHRLRGHNAYRMAGGCLSDHGYAKWMYSCETCDGDWQ